jgi:hypothetical protein
MKKIIVFCSLFSALIYTPNSSQAWIFGPSNFEECVSDGKVGRSNMEMRALHDLCRKKFPNKTQLKPEKYKLKKAYEGRDSKIVCESTDIESPNEKIVIEISDGNLIVEDRPLSDINKNGNILEAVFKSNNQEIVNRYRFNLKSGWLGILSVSDEPKKYGQDPETYREKFGDKHKKHREKYPESSWVSPNINDLNDSELTEYLYELHYSGTGRRSLYEFQGKFMYKKKFDLSNYSCSESWLPF